jgi:hypothetical protein
MTIASEKEGSDSTGKDFEGFGGKAWTLNYVPAADSTAGGNGIRYHDLHRQSVQEPRAPLRKSFIRRFIGVLKSMNHEEALVLIASPNGEYAYTLPARQIRKAGITIPNQPFEMNEIEVTVGDETFPTYEFKPLADLKSAYVETVKSSPEIKECDDLISRAFGKSKS